MPDINNPDYLRELDIMCYRFYSTYRDDPRQVWMCNKCHRERIWGVGHPQRISPNRPPVLPDPLLNCLKCNTQTRHSYSHLIPARTAAEEQASKIFAEKSRSLIEKPHTT